MQLFSIGPRTLTQDGDIALMIEDGVLVPVKRDYEAAGKLLDELVGPMLVEGERLHWAWVQQIVDAALKGIKADDD